jgi:hypothetical protein
MPIEQQKAFDPEIRWRYVESEGQTLVMDRQTDEVVAKIPAAGDVSFNRCNYRVLIAVEEQGIFIVDGETHQIIDHIPYLLEENPPSPAGDTNVYAVGAVSNAETNDYLILLRRLHYGYGGYWQEANLHQFDSTTLAINTNNSYPSTLSSNVVYDPVAKLFYATTYYRGLSSQKRVAAWDASWTEPPVRVLYGIGGSQARFGVGDHEVDGGQIRLDAAKRRLYVMHMGWEIALDADTFRIAGTYPEEPQAMPSVAENVEPDGRLDKVHLSPVYAQDHTLFLLTHRGLFRSTDDGKHWDHILLRFRPMNLVKPTVWLSPDYGNDQTIFVYLYAPNPNESEGLLKSTDGGDTWRPINTGLPSLRVNSFSISPHYRDDHTLWVSANDGSSFDSFVWMTSTDGGDTWHPADPTMAIPATPSPDVSSITCGGVSINLEGTVEQVVQTTAQDNLSVWFVVTKTKGVGYRVYTNSADACGHEVPIPATHSTGYAPYIAISPRYAIDQTLFIITSIYAGPAWDSALYQSTDGGDTWKKLPPYGSAQ